MHTFTRATSFAAMGFFFFACGVAPTAEVTGAGASTGSTGGEGGETGLESGPEVALFDMFCDTVKPTLCEAEYACCSSPLSYGNIGVEKCKTSVQLTWAMFCTSPSEKAALALNMRKGTLVFDPARFDDCLTILKTISAGGADCVQPAELVFRTTCMSAFRGQLPPGEACGYWPSLSDTELPCKDGVCQGQKWTDTLESGHCVPFLKTGDSCPLTFHSPIGAPAKTACNYLNKEVCWGAPDAGGAGGGGGADGGVTMMGTCLPQAEIGDACHPGNNFECKSARCDTTTSKCALADEWESACDAAF